MSKLRWDDPPKDFTHIQPPVLGRKDRSRRRKLAVESKRNPPVNRTVLHEFNLCSRPYSRYSDSVLNNLARDGWVEATRELLRRRQVSH